MPNKKNTFYGAGMLQATVSNYYPSADFVCFIFQQMIVDGSKSDDDYNLIAYAVYKTGPPVPVPLLSTNAVLDAKQKVQFANMKLDANTLGTVLYPSGVTSDLTITPYVFYKSTGYVVYNATTPSKIHPLTNTYTLNPSPPA